MKSAIKKIFRLTVTHRHIVYNSKTKQNCKDRHNKFKQAYS